MLRIGNLSMPIDGDMDLLRRRAARVLGVRPGALGELEIVRQSIDARKKDDVHYVYTVELAMPPWPGPPPAARSPWWSGRPMPFRL